MDCLQRRRGELIALVDQFVVADAATVRSAVDAINELTPIGRCADTAALTAAIPPPTDPAAAARVAALRDRLAEARAAGWTRKHAEGLSIAREVIEEAKTLAYRVHALTMSAGQSLVFYVWNTLPSDEDPAQEFIGPSPLTTAPITSSTTAPSLVTSGTSYDPNAYLKISLRALQAPTSTPPLRATLSAYLLLRTD